MLRKLLPKICAAVILIICTTGLNRAFAQNVTLASISGGLAPGTISSGSVHQAIYGFSVSVANDSKIFDQYNLTSSHNTQSFMANGTLYRLTNSNPFNYNTNRGTAVGNVIFNNQTITINGFKETITNTTYYYYLVVDAVNTINGYSVQIINSYGANLAHDVNGINYPLNQYSARAYDFSLGTPYALTVTNQTGGLAAPSTTITANTTGLKLFKFAVKNNSAAAITISGLNVNSNVPAIASHFSNFKLYANGTDSFPGSSTANGVMGASYVSYTGLSESINAGDTKFYWIVADCPTNALPGDVQFNLIDNQASVAIVTSTPNTSYNNFTAFGNTYNVNTAVITVTSQQGSASGGTLTAGQKDIVVFGFGVSSVPNISISQFNINSTGAPGTYFNNAKLYSCPTSTYSVESRVLVGNVVFDGSFSKAILITGEAITNAPKYYFLVADNISADASRPTIAFNFMNGQSASAIIQNSPVSSTYNNYTVTGNTFTIPAPTINYAINTTGYTQQTTIVKGQSAVLYGFTATPVGNITITDPYVEVATGNNPTGFFTGLQLWVSTSGSFATATQVIGASFSNAGSGMRASMPSPLSLNSGTSYSYYVVGTLQGNSSLPITYPVGINGIMSNNSANDYPTTELTSKNYYLTSAVVTITGNNSSLAGITQGSISFGQKDIVLFSFKLTAQGSFTISTMSIPSSNNMNSYFTNGRVYRSTSSTFSTSTAVPIPGATVSFSSGAYVNLGALNQTFSANSPTTYYYFMVADLTASTNMSPTTIQYNFTANQSPTAINSSSGAGDRFNGFVTTDGKLFNIVSSYIWTGNFDDSFNDTRNFTDIKGNSVTSISNSGVVTVAVNSYTRAPVVKSNITIGGITFANSPATPTLTINPSVTLTLNTALTLVNGTSTTITGPGLIVLQNTANSAVGDGCTLNLSSTTLSNAGTFTASAASVINLTNNSTINNTGTFTLASNATGTAAIGPLTGSSAIIGNITAERYVTGGSLVYRGYRLFSSPISDATVGGNKVYGVAYVKNSAFITGTTGSAGGFDAASGTPTIYLFREDKNPSVNPINGNYRGINKINDTLSYNLRVDNETGKINIPIGNGFMFFFRGNRATNSTTSTTAIPDAAIFSQTGTLNQGNVVVKNWYTPTSSNLGYTGTGDTGNSTIRGYNLIGNPYPSTIDWDVVKANSTDIDNTIYVYNSRLKTYGTYNGSTGTSDGSRYIASGQGLYVVATSANASVTFTESAKVTTAAQQPSGNTLLMGTPATETTAPQFLRLELSKDEFNREDMVVQFSKEASDGFIVNEDSRYLRGSNVVSLSSLATDNKDKPLAINKVQFPKKRTSIPLNVLVNSVGIYQLTLTEAKNIPKMFDVWLMDAYKRDSLDIKNNATYNFNATTDAATYGADRFSLVIRPNAAYSYHLLDFVAAKQTSAVQLTWKVENEENYTYFTVERSTNGGKSYDVIGSAVGKSLANYSLQDKLPAIGENLYRLKQEDYFGTITYSNVIPVMYTPSKDVVADNRVNVYPNPVSANLNIAVKTTSVNNAAYKISITNTSGSVVKTITSTQPNWQGSVSDLLPGTYFIQVVNNNDNSIVGKNTFIKI